MTALIHPQVVQAYLAGNAHVVRRLQAHAPASLALSAVAVCEFIFADTMVESQSLKIALAAIISAIPILPFDRYAAELAGKILAEAARAGRRISCIDAQIAGHALAMDIPLIIVRPKPITVRGLRMVDWSSPRPIRP